MRVLHAFVAATAVTGIAAGTLTALTSRPASQPKAHQPMLVAAAPLVAKPVPTETYTRQAPAAAPAVAAAPVRVILANPYGATVAPVVVATVAPKAEAPRAEPPLAEEIAKEPRRRIDRERERRAQAAEDESNVCTRHNLRKVWVSERRWRCRK
jgi:hypothetical protein